MPCQKPLNEESQQLKTSNYSTSTWLYQESNLDWNHVYLPQGNIPSLANHHLKMSDSLEQFSYIQPNWDGEEDLHELSAPQSGLLPSFQYEHSHYTNDQARLVFSVPPENIFRYRYDTEMSGTHGSLQGMRNGTDKCVPTVELQNFRLQALIRVTLVSCRERLPHPHNLFVKQKLYEKKMYTNWDKKTLTRTGHYSDPHYIRVGNSRNNYTARFEGMCIINTKKENFHASVQEKLRMRCLELSRPGESEALAEEVDKAVNAVDVDFVSLCFEAFTEENGKLHRICPPLYSEPIGNAKSAKTGKLKISKINKCSGSCKGGDEIWLLVEKINKKGLVVKFRELRNGNVFWESRIEGDNLTLHHQYAIIFKTPPYKDVNISSGVAVQIRLERTIQPNQPPDYSESLTFVYEPLEEKFIKGDNLCKKEAIFYPLIQNYTKRPRTESCAFGFGWEAKRRTDELEHEDPDIEALLHENSLDPGQPDIKTNFEEILSYLAVEGEDMQIQRDGVAHSSKSRKDFFKLCMRFYKRLDEREKLAEQISKFRVSKKEVCGGAEKDQVKAAASTLLSLRSKAMLINNCDEPEGEQKLLDDAVFPNRTFNQILGTGGEFDLEGQNPGHASVIKFNFPKAKCFSDRGEKGKRLRHPGPQKFLADIDSDGDTKSFVDLDRFGPKEIKKEAGLFEDLMDEEGIENICRTLNENGSWKSLADAWKCSGLVPSAKESANPARFILQHIRDIHGTVDPEAFRTKLNAINEKKAAKMLDEVLGKKCF